MGEVLRRGSARFTLLFALASTIVVVAPSGDAAAVGGFVQTPLPLLRTHGIRDLAVTDADVDGHLDVYTVNHSERENLLVGAGDGTFRQKMETWGLAQDLRFPTLVYSAAVLPPPPPGAVHLAWSMTPERQRLVIRVPRAPVSGSLEFLSPVVTHRYGTVSRRVAVQELPNRISRSVVRFTSKGPGKLVIAVHEVGTPVEVRLRSEAPIRVGVPPVPAPQRFRLFRRDRHAMAWADIDGGPRPEVAIVRGGMKGRALQYPVELFQELRRFDRGRYRDLGPRAGLAHNGCSSQAAEWTDATDDGQLDLFVACNHGQPNRLFVQDRGRFVEQAQRMGLSASIEPVLWLDADEDDDTDMIAVLLGQVLLFENQGGSFTRRVILEIPSHGVRGLSLLPVDDGITFAVVANAASGLVTMDSGSSPTWTGFEELDLPTTLVHASWVDYDNDGDQDLYAYPGGLYQQVLPGTFSFAAEQPPVPIADAEMVRVAWFDANEDGRLDFLGAFLPVRAFPLLWQVSYALNDVETVNHWLAVDVRGPAGNRSGIGAIVTASTPLGSMTSLVGSFESSRNSQGHYRIYFGLGSNAGPVQLEVRWPDGTVDQLAAGGVDRLLTVRYEPD